MVNLEDLIDLVEELRRAGYNVGTERCVAAQTLLVNLAAHASWPVAPQDLSDWLAPVFCSSPKEQEDFHRHFANWLAHRPYLSEWDIEVEEIPREEYLKDSRQRTSSRRRLWKPAAVVIVALAAAALAAYFVYLRSHKLTGKVVSPGGAPLTNVEIGFRGRLTQQTVYTNPSGEYTITHRRADLPATVTASHVTEGTAEFNVEASRQEPLLTVLQPVAAPLSTDNRRFVQLTEAAPVHPVVNTAQPQPGSSVWPAVLAVGLLTLQLLITWFSLRAYRGRAQLRKLQSAKRPTIVGLPVEDTTGRLARPQVFRHLAREMRRHQQHLLHELDEQLTVQATAQGAGLFIPRYLSRKTIPEYLVLIDRLTLSDQQARMEDETINYLVADDVFVDRYYFQNDPRICRKAKGAPQLTLKDLAAAHPSHTLIVISDGSGLINPFTGEAEKWLAEFAPWERRVLMTPEPSRLWGAREKRLSGAGFLVLPDGYDGLSALVKAVETGAAPGPYRAQRARPFPEMLRERPRRWLERQEPPPESARTLCQQLRDHLGANGYYWLSACAVYPALTWELTLYLGFTLLTKQDVEGTLGSLVRLPWLRHGTMPDWLRLRLISDMTAAQEKAVRRALEDVLLSALAYPVGGPRLEIAFGPAVSESSREGKSASKLAGVVNRLRRAKLLRKLFKAGKRNKTLQDYTFLTFMRGRKPDSLAVRVPETLRQMFLPPRHAVRRLFPNYGLLGRLAAPSLSFLAPVVSLVFFSVLFLTVAPRLSPSGLPLPAAPMPSPAPSPSPEVTLTYSKSYQEMSEEERLDFINQRAQHINIMIGGRSRSIPPDGLRAIKFWVDAYARRVGNNRAGLWNGDTRFILERARAYAPTIIRAFKDHNVPPIVGLYIPFIETEYTNTPAENYTGAAGLFLFIPQAARAFGVEPSERTNIDKMAPAAAKYFRNNIMMFGDDPMSVALAIAGYSRAPESVMRDLRNVILAPNNNNKERDFWLLVSNEAELDNYFQNENKNYVPRFYAAAIVGETPRVFGIDAEPLSALDPTPGTQTTAPRFARQNETERDDVAVRNVARLISGDDGSFYISEAGTRDIAAKVEFYRGSLDLKDRLNAMRRACAEVRDGAQRINLKTPLVIYAALAETEGGSDPAATARQMSQKLLTLRATFGTDTANSALLLVAAYPYPFNPPIGTQQRTVHPLYAELIRSGGQRSRVAPSVARSVWFLREQGSLRPDAYELVVRTLAIGVVAQNPRLYGIDADPLAC